ncbi:sulfate adenylyltransferase subunit 2 [Geobacter sulfurreducens]|jgi:sulfate adenylyltransferase subunit 2|uniref:Sulfate adenylyltransferase subunit 2 n=1 Tax=Geobacter sulfurreducens (strain ATCC 51573 / DSM 12127 / PCA) TaxID=243231 RepID=Q74CF7_GEOSL|nr:sulfate adenylyltransferase subunit CysD [Geobacter sulfurreducens]AAR35094.1 sulfate adenylyltransferase, subunit 2 [Geobacter sulfurreducens PCA]ADI84548.1 sulfate adenylyltransferase, subunit 2 [Geobacter sulfurreducens KN400]AJY71279.1 sulfate adenylyltransferase [Geobacter sulfurreducens]QVW36867.1 sulfate adenylyltransferase subunit 2 [Geobacter sulfurreducens]UAC05712.1 sulfate adenylyltransferase subunit 2 [Geobacter sulfurreducens]
MNSHLDELEAQSIYIFREAYRKFENLAMLYSVGKDSTTMIHLARKAFFGRIPFPLVHIDTTYKYPEMIEYRDRMAREWGADLIVGRNESAIAAGTGPEQGRLDCCAKLKTDGLSQTIERHGFNGLFLGIRRDEEGSRAKERVFSPRDKNFEWSYKDQPPELWDQFNTTFAPGTHIRVHPILHWTELDIWLYIQREGIELCPLYFARDGKRFRSLGCMPCTGPIQSNAVTVEEIIEELRAIKTPERAGRAQDQENTYAMQKLRAKGYM